MKFLINFFLFSCTDSKNLLTNERSYNPTISIFISNCYFTRSIFFSGNGGIIYINELNINLIVEFSIFFKCSCTGGGGSIYYFCQLTYSSIYLTKICANECLCGSGNSGAFSLMLVNNDINNNISISYLSISKCANNGLGWRSIYSQYGNQNFNFINSSNNNCYSTSGIIYAHPKKLISKFSSFKYNNSNKDIILDLNGGSNNLNLLFLNIISNNSPNGNGIIHVASGNYLISNSIFYNNSLILYSLNSGSLILENNLIHHNFLNSLISGNVQTALNNSILTTFFDTYKFNFFSTIHCESKLNLKITFSKKIIYFYFQIYNLIILI